MEKIVEKIRVKKGKSHCFPTEASVRSIRKAIRKVFPQETFPKSPIWAYKGKAWNSFHDPQPDGVVFVNRTGQEWVIEVQVDEDVKRHIEIWKFSRKA